MLFVSIKFSLEKDSVIFSAFVNYCQRGGRPQRIIEPYVSTEEKSHLSVRDLFLTIFGCK